MTQLFKKDNTGGLRFWEIHPTYCGIEIKHGKVGGATQYKYENVEEGKAGRDLDEQIESRLQSRINKKIDEGYCYSAAEALKRGGLNALDLQLPMLAHSIKNYDIDGYAFVQHKYDGNRMLVHNNDGTLIAYTRNGKKVTTLDHILDNLDIPHGTTLDGEIYCHGVPLQTIVSWVKRKQPDTLKLTYVVYDVISPLNYNERYAILRGLLQDCAPCITLAKTDLYCTGELQHDSINKLLRDSIAKGYEGLIIRTDDTGYQAGKRSKSLLKVKRWLSTEVICKDIEESEDGWGIAVCDYNGKEVRVSCPGDMGMRREALINKHRYIGKKLTIEYANLTKDGVPFHPVAIAWRDYE